MNTTITGEWNPTLISPVRSTMMCSSIWGITERNMVGWDQISDSFPPKIRLYSLSDVLFQIAAGFTIAFREFMGTVPTLWDTIRKFKRDHPEVTNNLPAKKDTLFSFITDDNGNSYNGCHFWTNFEVRWGYTAIFSCLFSICSYTHSYLLSTGGYFTQIASLDLWRSNDYLKLFSYLDRSGGFFYER